MTDKQRLYCLSESDNYADRDSYISDLALSSIWGGEEGDIPPDRIDALGCLWDSWHRSVKDICSASGLTQRGLAARFAIPYRTVEDWCRGVRTPPDYVRLMMQECLGLSERP